MEHISVLKEETFNYLNLKADGTLLDCTLGLGGHSEYVLSRLGPSAKVLAFEVDSENLEFAKNRLSSFQNQVTYVQDNFVNLKTHIEELGTSCLQAIFFDLGLSSAQVDKGARGFSFLREGPLDMRFDKRSNRTAEELIQKLSPKELTRIFKEYGEDPYAHLIAEKIVKVRKSSPFKTTTQLANYIAQFVPRRGKEHPATRVFQALRIAVNNELDVLAEALKDAISVLCPGGRIVVISYHSLEDRIVKNVFKAHLSHQELEILTKKPLTPSFEEIKANPRARSAKLRAGEKICHN